jgi:hypothetical protein
MTRPIWAREPALRLPGWNPWLEMPQRSHAYILFSAGIFLIELVHQVSGIKLQITVFLIDRINCYLNLAGPIGIPFIANRASLRKTIRKYSGAPFHLLIGVLLRTIP